eukprot:scaffold42042_cov80-Phaeocystis_antarctica.AAC.1
MSVVCASASGGLFFEARRKVPKFQQVPRRGREIVGGSKVPRFQRTGSGEVPGSRFLGPGGGGTLHRVDRVGRPPPSSLSPPSAFSYGPTATALR